MTKHNLKILRSEILTNLGHLERYNPPPPSPLNGTCFWSFILEKKAFFFSKRSLPAATASNKWLK